MRKLILLTLINLLSLFIANAQEIQSQKQLKKSEPFANLGGLVFIDKTSTITVIKEISYDEFVSYYKQKIEDKSFVSFDSPVFGLLGKTRSIWIHDKIVADKDGAFDKTKYAGVRQDIDVSLVSLEENEVIINVIFNDERFDNVYLKKDSVVIIPIILDFKNDIIGFFALRAHDFGLQVMPCSAEEIANDIINKNKEKLCF